MVDQLRDRMDRYMKEIKLSLLNTSMRQRRHTWEYIGKLADHMGAHGLLSPLTVTPIAGGEYHIISGLARYEAARLLGYEQIQCDVVEVEEMAECAVCRPEALTIKELGEEMLHHMEHFPNVTYEKLAELEGLAPSTIRKYIARAKKAREAKKAIDKSPQGA